MQIYEVETPEEAVALARLGVDHIGVLVGDGAFPRELPAAQRNSPREDGNASAAASSAGARRATRRPQSDFSSVSALDTAYWPGASTLSALTTPSSTSIE